MKPHLGFAAALLLVASTPALAVAQDAGQSQRVCDGSSGAPCEGTTSTTGELPNAEAPANDTAASRSSKERGTHRASAFAHGKADRLAWETWFSSQTGESHAGAEYWASHRSLKRPQSCDEAKPVEANLDWAAGCQQAKEQLAPFDRLRSRSREYRRGWNSIPAPPPATTVGSYEDPALKSSSSGGIWLVIIAAAAVTFWLMAVRRKPKVRPEPYGAHREPVQPRPMTSTRPEPTPAAPHTVQVSAIPAQRPQVAMRTSPGQPSNEELKSESAAAWRKRGETIRIQQIDIPGGLIYVGQTLRAKERYGEPDNCLINPALNARSGDDQDADSHLDYWPSYSRLPASTRRAYLRWLASDRSDPNTNIGYVFLYFYGLERRLMLDLWADDRAEVLAEVERLRQVYGANGSFRGYSSRLISAVRVLLGAQAGVEPVYERDGHETPMSVRIALGRFAARREPIPPEWILSWVMTDPLLYLRTPAARDLDTFKEVFALRWSETKPRGVTFTDAQLERFPKIKADYRAASNTFTASVRLSEALPDVTGSKQTLNRAHQVALKCCEELDGYSRLIGRRPELAGSIGAAALLPATTQRWRSARDAVASFASAAETRPLGEIVGLVEGGDKLEKVSPNQCRKAAEALRALGYGIAPDPHLTLARVAADTPSRLAELPAGSDSITEPMSSTALVLQIGALIAAADGVIAPEEREALLHAAEISGLDPRQLARLRLQADWLLDVPARPSDLKQRLADASPETRALVVDVALDLARADSRIAAAEVKQLEKLFEWMGLPTAKLYSALHGSEPVEIAGEEAAPKGQPIPRPAPQRRTFDKSKIASIAADSAKSAALLQAVFTAEEETSAAPPPTPTAAPGSTFAGLPSKLATFAEALCARDAWPATELAALAAAHDTMLEGALERLNDWAMDRWDDLLIEYGDPTIINRALLREGAEA